MTETRRSAGVTAELLDRHSAVVGLAARARALVDDFTTEAAPYDSVPRALLDADFVPAAHLNVTLFFRSWLDGCEPSDIDTRPLVDRAVSLMRDGMPLHDVLENYRVGVYFLWSQLASSASQSEQPLLAEVGLPLTRYLSLVMARIASACVEEARTRPWDELERRRGILDALLAGRDPGAWTSGEATTVAEAFLVAVVRLGEPSPGTLTELRHRIHDLPGSLLRRDVGGWTALIPVEPAADSAAATAELAARLGPRAADGTPPSLWVGVSHASTHTAVPASFAEARVVAELGRCLAREEIVCRRQDLRFEYAVAVDSSARHELASVLQPLADQPVLAQTLDAFFTNDCNQNAAARILCVHRNTVTYRLLRIGELTGYDPQHPAEAMTLSAARIAALLESKSFAA